jgi:hypothetical protein
VTISGTVTIPVEVQRLFSKAQPGSVEVLPSRAGGAVTLPYLCDPTDAPLVFPYTVRDENCAVEQLIEVRAYKVAADFLERVRCGEPSRGSGGTKGQEVAYASAPVFQGQSDCESGSATADLTLQIK